MAVRVKGLCCTRPSNKNLFKTNKEGRLKKKTLTWILSADPRNHGIVWKTLRCSPVRGRLQEWFSLLQIDRADKQSANHTNKQSERHKGRERVPCTQTEGDKAGKKNFFAHFTSLRGLASVIIPRQWRDFRKIDKQTVFYFFSFSLPWLWHK